MRKLTPCLLLFLLAGVVGADENPSAEPEALKRYHASNGRLSISLPTAWTVELVDRAHAVQGYQCVIPDVAGDLRIAVYRLPGLRSPRAQAYTELPVMMRRHKTKDVVVRLLPRPHLISKARGGDAKTHLIWTYGFVDGCGYTVYGTAAPETWEKARDPFLRIIDSLAAVYGSWPAIPAGYETQESGLYTLVLHPDVTPVDSKAILKFVRSEQSLFERRHGKLEARAGEPVQVVVHPTARTMKQNFKDLSSDGFDVIGRERRVWAIPFKRGDYARRAAFGANLATLFLRMRYGVVQPRWLELGERRMARSRHLVGRGLPTVCDKLALQFSEAVAPFAQIAAGNAGASQSLIYLALFTIGPKKYRKAFDHYLETYATTGDWAGAEREHLRTLDQGELLAAAAKLCTEKLKAKPARKSR